MPMHDKTRANVSLRDQASLIPQGMGKDTDAMEYDEDKVSCLLLARRH